MGAKRSPHFHYHNAFHALDVLPNIPIHHLPLKRTIKLISDKYFAASPRKKALKLKRFYFFLSGVFFCFQSTDNQLTLPMDGKNELLLTDGVVVIEGTVG